MAVTLAGCKGDRPKEVQEKGEKGGMKTIVAVGDSLTAGFGVAEEESYPALLEKKLQADGHQYRVVNAGVSAETSSGTLARLEWILTLNPDIVILETGANDGLRGIDPQVAENNVREILRILADRGVVVLLVGMKMVRNLGPLYVAKFNALYPKLAEESGAVFMPFFLEGIAMQAGLNQADGVHPNAFGYKKVVENLYPYVVEAIKKRQRR
ncbi:MAG: arylesterase [Pseudomonadota bacterium]